MRVIKVLASLAAACFLAYLTWDLLDDLFLRPITIFSFWEQFLLAFLTNLFVTGIFALPGFVLPTHKLLPPRVYKIQNATGLDKLYMNLGVSVFRKLLMFFFWGRKRNRKKFFNGSRYGFDNLIFQSKQAEFGHLSALVIIGLLALAMLYKGYWMLSALVTLINIIGNLYPVILQRKHRMRVERMLS